MIAVVPVLAEPTEEASATVGRNPGATASATEPVASPKRPAETTVVANNGLTDESRVQLLVSQSRVLKLSGRLSNATVGDSGIAQVAVSGEDLTISGRFPGATTLILTDDAGRKSFISVTVQTEAEASQVPSRARSVKLVPVGSSDRIILTGDVDSPEQLLRLFTNGNASTNDRGMNVESANDRLINVRPGEGKN